MVPDSHLHRSLLREGTLMGIAGMPSTARLLLLLGVVVAACALPACRGGSSRDAYAVSTGGNWRTGRQLIVKYRCGACHTIPGIYDANGRVGPPLMWFAQRSFIGGELPNSQENLVRWLLDPKAVEPGTAMPDLGLSEQDARDVAAYLYTLK
jgi:cytochrome c1